jgi:hypothetical protein
MHKIKSKFWWIVWSVIFLTMCCFYVFVQWAADCTISESWAMSGGMLLAWALQEIHLMKQLLAEKEEIIREHERTNNSLTWNVIRAHKNREPS